MKIGLWDRKLWLFDVMSFPFVSMFFPGLGCERQQSGEAAGHSGVLIFFYQLCLSALLWEIPPRHKTKPSNSQFNLFRSAET